MRQLSIGWALLVLLAGCASAGARTTTASAPPSAPAATAAAASQETAAGIGPQYPSTYQRHPNPPVLIRNATIMTAAGQEIQGGSILFKDGRIVSVGTSVQAPSDAVVVDGTGKWVTPGVIDTHSHIGVYAAPGTFAESDGNEATRPVTAEVWAEHSFWPQDPQIPLAIAGGVTTIQALPGSANLIGGRSAVLKAYRLKWDKWNKDHQGDPPERNLRNETLAEVLRGNIYVHNHCYRADEMMQMLDLAHEFGFKIRSFHHAVEAYKIADVLAREGTASSIWSDWWGFKEEAMDGIYENGALLQQAGARVVIHSDDASGIQRLNQEAAKAMYHGRRAGIPITRDQAVRWFTANPAWALGLDSIVGTLEPGKMADVVLWSADPLSVYARAVQVYNDGWLVYDRNDPAHQPKTDFSLGQP